MQTIARFILRLFGWQAELAVQMVDRCVLVCAPHTSNWDFPLAILGMAAMGIKFNWVAKHTLFRWPMGYIMRSLGGIPLDRKSGGTGFAIKAVENFQSLDRFILAIAPEGTRRKTKHWKAGFYKIALKSRVPVALGYVDFSSKKVGIGQIFMPSGNLEEDFVLIRDFYCDKTGRHPDKQGQITP